MTTSTTITPATPTTDRKVILAVIYFLGAYALTSLTIIAILVAVLNKRGEITATHIAILGLISNPMSTAVGLIGGLLGSTRSNPETSFSTTSTPPAETDAPPLPPTVQPPPYRPEEHTP